ncbi:Uncharacterized protein TCM_005621 [Theobroma cacao]|uniref:Uncharacterized protein n=1 Tax=Theobroma cacao TaxID=3641 RepID=A0A061E258_THECC|nr:Uncharacterized protein TCM_005621 [Theobroma cacao]
MDMDKKQWSKTNRNGTSFPFPTMCGQSNESNVSRIASRKECSKSLGSPISSFVGPALPTSEHYLFPSFIAAGSYPHSDDHTLCEWDPLIFQCKYANYGSRREYFSKLALSTWTLSFGVAVV